MAKNNVSLGSKLGISSEILDVVKQQICDMIYPVGAIYISYNSTSPATLFGGTWTEINGRFLLSQSSSYAAGSTGGNATHTLTKYNLPNHSHTYIDGRHAYAQSTNGTGIIAYGGGTTGCYGYATGGASWSGNYGSKGDDIAGNLKAEPFDIMPPYLAVYMWQRTA